MTNYGSIPTSSSPSELSWKPDYIKRAKEQIRSRIGARRPWRTMFNYHSINLPSNFSEALTRVKTNLAYFRMNYAIVSLALLCLSLLWHPISLIVFIIMMAAWLFLYFLRDQPSVGFHCMIHDRVVLIGLLLLTLVFLFLTNATWNILSASLIAVVVMAVHAVLRKTDDLFLDEEATGLMWAEHSGALGWLWLIFVICQGISVFLQAI